MTREAVARVLTNMETVGSRLEQALDAMPLEKWIARCEVGQIRYNIVAALQSAGLFRERTCATCRWFRTTTYRDGNPYRGRCEQSVLLSRMKDHVPPDFGCTLHAPVPDPPPPQEPQS